MISIDKLDFNYHVRSDIVQCRPNNGDAPKKGKHTMHTLMNPDVLVGFGTVLAIAFLAALEYWPNWRRIFGR